MAEVTFKQSVGHLGDTITFMAAHGNMRTMKFEKVAAHTKWLDEIGELIKKKKHNVKFLYGDFNMSLTLVPKLLESRGIHCDVAAWYPWQQPLGSNPLAKPGQATLGIDDSCAIFYIGGNAMVRLVWELGDIDKLAAANGNEEALDVFHGGVHPGQPWQCYRTKKIRRLIHKTRISGIA